jgi:hypothetical protein
VKGSTALDPGDAEVTLGRPHAHPEPMRAVNNGRVTIIPKNNNK